MDRRKQVFTPEQIEHNRIISKQWKLDNPERWKQTKRNWDLANIEKSREYKRNYNKRNPAKCNILKRISRERNPIADILTGCRGRAKEKGLEFNITKEDIFLPTHCPILRIPIQRNSTPQDNSYSVDRIDNSKGYIKGNVRVISNKANRLKSNATIKELELILQYMKENNIDN